MSDFEPAVSNLQPFAKGDVFLGATFLNNPDDDHAGRGRILQFDQDLNFKGTLWIDDTTHLVGGLNFAPDGTLWAFDSFAWKVVRVTPEATLLPTKSFADRPFGSVQFLPNGNFALVEYLKGSAQPENLTTRYPYLPDDPENVGQGKIYVYDKTEALVQTLEPDVHGGVSGSMGATHTALGSDGKTLIYTSETGPRLMQFDLESGAQGEDLMTLPPGDGRGPPPMVFDVKSMDDKLVMPLGTKLSVLTESGEVIQDVPLPGFGWALAAAGTDQTYAYAANWFTGDVVKVSLETGEVLAQVTIAPTSLSGLIQFHG
ncbi:MAG: hypothetical protein GKS03_01110 [Alphaproteobacteria bacterium]|nr:hypothetical protein [Alphaproteobacteria bacterium]